MSLCVDDCLVSRSICSCIPNLHLYILLDSVTSRVKRQRSSGLLKSIEGNQSAGMANYRYVLSMRERIFSREVFKWKRP